MPANERVIGLDTFTEQPKRREYVQGEGWQIVRRWEGPQDRADDQEQLVLLDEPDSISTELGVPAVIEARWKETGGESNTQLPVPEPDAGEINATWELIGERLEKDLATHGYFNVSGISPYMLARVDADIRKGSANQDYNTLFGMTGDAAHINTYRDLRMQGTNSYQSYTWIIRKTVSTSSTSLVKQAQTDVGKVLTYAQVKALDIHGGGGWKWEQPKVRTYNDVQAAAWANRLIDAWLTQPSSIVKKGSSKWDIVQEWWGAASWSSYLYEAAT